MSRTVKGLFILMACILFGTAIASASTFYVKPGGGGGEFATLSDALTTVGAYAGNDHIIIVRAGTYTTDANLTVPANIAEIYGEDKNAVIFQAPLATDNFLLTGGAQSGFKLHDMTIKGFNIAVYKAGGLANDYRALICTGGTYTIYLVAGVAGCTVTQNCFLGNSVLPQGYDNNGPGVNNWYNNFFSNNATIGNYLLAPGGTNWDWSPQTLNNSAVAVSPQEIGTTFDVNVEWTVPGCDVKKLAAYDFTLTFDATKLEFVSAEFDTLFLGGAADGALYVGPTAGAGTVQFAATNFTKPGEGSHRLAVLKFKAIALATPTNITLASDYRDENNVALAVRNTPLSITIQDTEVPTLDPIVEIDPLGFDTYSDGSVVGGNYQLKLKLHAHDNLNLAMISASADSIGWGDWYAVSGMDYTTDSVYVPLPTWYPSEGAKKLWLRVRDGSGNISAPRRYDFTVDRTGPTLTSITLSDSDGCAPNAEFTNQSNVKVASVASDLGPGTVRQQFYVDGGPWLPATSPFLVYPQALVSLGATPSQGSHIVYSRLYDAFGNMGNQTSDNIKFDNVAPTITGPMALGGWPPPGPAKTNVLSVLGYFNAWDADRMQAHYSTNSSDFTCAATWGAIAYPVPVTLPSGDGWKKIYFAIRDSAGNVSNLVMDSIEVDQTAPAITSVTVKSPSGGNCTNVYAGNQVTVVFSATDAVWLKLDDGGAVSTYGDGVTILTSPLTVAYNMTGGYPPPPTTVTINAKLVDNATNVGPNTTGTILLDWQAPTLTGLNIADAVATAAPVYPALGEAAASVSNSKTVNLVLTGLPTDATSLWVSEDGFVADSAVVALSSPGDPATVSYTYRGAGVECAYNTLTVKARDCAGNTSPVQSDAVYFDLTAPTLTSVAGPALTNTPLISLTLTASDNCFLYIMRLSEDPAFTAVPWVAYSATPSFTLSAGDGPKTVHVQIADYTGNVASGSLAVTLDQTAPSGTAVVRKIAGLPNTLAGWTNTLAGNEIASITPNGGAVKMWLQNSDGSGATGWIPITATHGPWTLVAGGDGLRTVNIYFQDAALNQSPAIPLTIMYDATAPAAPATASAVPSGSAFIDWTPVAGAQKYIVRYNFSGDYPVYLNPNPPAPNDVQGFLAGEPVKDSMTFEGPHKDKYHFSIWTVDSAGNKSVGYNTQAECTNYFLGDFRAEAGCLDFPGEFLALAMHYGQNSGNPAFNDSLDIGPTSNNLGTGLPQPDLNIDFEDLVIFGMNYDEHSCSFAAAGQSRPSMESSPASARPVKMIADVPGSVRSGAEYTVVLRAANDELAGIKAYHVILNYNHDVADLVKIEAGAMHSSVAEQFFFVDKAKTNIDITGAVFGAGVVFTGEEIARVTFKAKANGDLALTSDKLDLRDRSNGRIESSLAFNQSVGTLPAEFALAQNYPNPFNPTTSIELAIPTACDYTLTIYNITGQAVDVFKGHSEPGYLKINWNAQNFASGVYLYKMVTDKFTDTKKMVLLK